MNNKVVIYAIIFVLGVVAAPAVRGLPVLNKLPSIG